MNHLDKTFWDMEKSCISFMVNNSSAWDKNPLISNDVNALIENEKELSDAALLQTETDTSGLVNQKKQDVQLLGKDIYRLSCSLSHLAKKTNDQVLLKTVDYSESRLMSGEERELFMRLGKLINTARTKLAELAAYGVTAEQLDGYEARLKKLEELPDSINLQSGTRKSASRTIKELIAEARILLDCLDDALEAMITDEKFLNDWFDARKIKGRRRVENNGNDSNNVENSTK